MMNVLYLSFSVMLGMIFMFMSMFSSKSSYSEKLSTFECGFDVAGSTRLPFCMKFFLLCVMFLIFDVEVVLILPLPFSKSLIVFLIMLILGLSYEWYYGGLEWM